VHLCRWIAGEPQPLASQQVRWVAPAELDAYPFPAANARIIAALRERLTGNAAAEGSDAAQSLESRPTS
jgi:A/G-specific adenine glycosylase